MGIQQFPSGKFRARIWVDGDLKHSHCFDTRKEAEEWLAERKKLQLDAKAARRSATQAARDAIRDDNIEQLQANMQTYGDSCAKDTLARDLVALAARDHPVLRVCSGVEYSIDIHAFRRADDLGFNALLDVEPDAGVPTLAIENKLTQTLKPTRGTMDNPQVTFKNIDYADRDATIVLMMYTPEKFKVASEEALKETVFWWEIAKGWAPAHGVKRYSLHNSREAKDIGIKGRGIADRLAAELERRVRIGAGLIPYSERCRQFRSEDHRLGQAAIDALEDQVLRPIGARFVPPESAEGGPDDRILVFGRDFGHHKEGDRLVVQVKKVLLMAGHAGFYANMYRANGSFDGHMQHRPYHTSDGIDLFLFAALRDDDSLAEYWAAYVPDLLGGHAAYRLIGDENAPGVTGIYVHPLLKDKAALGDVVPNDVHQDSMAVRTRGWLRKLGPIVSAEDAAKLKADAVSFTRALRLSAKAQAAAEAAQAAQAAAEEAKSKAGPSYVTNNIDNSTHNHNHLHLHHPQLDVPPGKRRLISDYFGSV